MLDTHADPDHHRAVLTLAGAPGVAGGRAGRRRARRRVARIDLRGATRASTRTSARSTSRPSSSSTTRGAARRCAEALVAADAARRALGLPGLPLRRCSAAGARARSCAAAARPSWRGACATRSCARLRPAAHRIRRPARCSSRPARRSSPSTSSSRRPRRVADARRIAARDPRGRRRGAARRPRARPRAGGARRRRAGLHERRGPPSRCRSPAARGGRRATRPSAGCRAGRAWRPRAAVRGLPGRRADPQPPDGRGALSRAPRVQPWPRRSASAGTKHRGNAAGMVETRGRTGRRRRGAERKADAQGAGALRAARAPPTWRGAVNRAAIAAVHLRRGHRRCSSARASAPARRRSARSCSCSTSRWATTPTCAIYRRRQTAARRAGKDKLSAMDVRMFTVGPVPENCFLVRAPTAATAP